MQLEHEFTVPVPASQAWPVLLDIERIAPCMPGATVTAVDGREFDGKVKVKVGPIQVTYDGHARFAEVDDDNHRAVIEAKGKEARGAGTATATITAQLHDDGSSSRVTVVTDLAITGRPAQFGRGVMNDVGNKLLGRFAECLAGKLGEGDGSAADAAGSADPGSAAGSAAAATPAATPTESRPVDGEVSPPAQTVGVTDAVDGSDPQPQSTPPAQAAPLPGPTHTVAPPTPTPPRARPQHTAVTDAEPIDLLEAAGGAVAKRLAPVGAALVALVAFLLWRRRR